MMQNSRLRFTGILLTFVGVIAFLAYPFLSPLIVTALEKWVSPDGQISAGGVEQLTIAFYFGTSILIVAGILIWVFSSKGGFKTKISNLVTKDPLFPDGNVKPYPVVILLVSTLAGLLMTVSMYLIQPDTSIFNFLYEEDALFENLTAVAFLLSSFFMATAVFISRNHIENGLPKWLKAFFVLSSLAFFFIGMEEISWGQRIFGWSTPEVFQENNVQNETNLHNFFNSVFPVLYRLPAILPFFVLFGVWLEAKKKWLLFSRFALPAFSLIGLSIVISFVAIIWDHQELLEELGSLFVLLYSLRLFIFKGSKKRIVRPTRSESLL